jgi:general secretion pathway protein B
MSFILDALRKADAERHLGEVPDIHTQPMSNPETPVRATPWPKGASWAMVALGTIATGVLAWRMTVSDDAARLVERPPVPQAVIVAQAPAEKALANPTPVAREPVIAEELPVPPPLPKPVARTVVKPVAKAPGETVAATAPEGKPAALAALTKESVAPVASQRIPAIGELPQNLRNELPSLAFTGSMYSENPANRMVLLNKRLLREGDEIVPGLVLENLAPRAATLHYKGHRFQVSY